ncbi:MAG: hypothetical protein GXY61_08960 [Lentisphaerae bacterium]|nr:hypothetical protein [Lentisphaerota bacterium]
MSLFSLLMSSCSPKERTITDLNPDRHNEYYQKGCDLIQPFMVLHGNEITPPQKRKVSDGIMYLDAVTKINPENWAAFWIKGKGYQALNDSLSAYTEFKSSYSIQKENPDVARELMIECLNLGKADEGVQVAREALSLRPKESGLVANLALALLIQGNLDEAMFQIDKAISLDPSDEINKNVRSFILEVKSGQRKPPKTYHDLMK